MFQNFTYVCNLHSNYDSNCLSRKLMLGKKHHWCTLNITCTRTAKEKEHQSITMGNLMEYPSCLFLEMLAPTNKVPTFPILSIF